MPTLQDLTLPPQPPTNGRDLNFALNLTTLLTNPQEDTPGNLTWGAAVAGEDGGEGGGGTGSPPANWWGLVALLVVLLTLFGNILLILAISWDRRLQNMTNYFLLSLAVTDLMVASLVMPLSIVVLVLGHFPFSSELCLLWISLDVLFCTASIMHLCTLSVDRFLSLRYPIKFGRHKTRRRVVLKIVLVWCLSLAASLPLSLMYATAPHTTIVDGVCQIPVSLFQIIGSVICFYIPLVIMLVTYALTVRLLSQKQSELHSSVLEPASASASPSPRSLRWKRLLCKTTSTLSTSTAVSLTDGEVSEAVCRPEPSGPHAKLRRLGSSPQRRPPLVRYASHHYHHRAALVRADGCSLRGFSTRELHGPTQQQSFPQLVAAAPAYEMSVLPPAARSAPSSTTTSPLHRRHQHHRQEGAAGDQEGSSVAPSYEQNGDPRGGTRERCGEECEDEMGGARGGGQVAVPCSCAPRFFLEDMKAQDTQCEECAAPQPIEAAVHYSAPQPRRSQDASQARGGASWCCCCCCPAALMRLTRRHHAREAGAPLSSPWHEGSSPPRPAHNLVTRANLRSGGQVTTLLQKGGSTDSGSSPRGLWRQQSCSASLKFVSSKRHGRNLRMEQKATKVLGVVFFTFVLLWAPFFIANVLISCGAHIGEGMINLVTWLGYASSMVNPFFYTFFNKTFRQTFLKIMKCDIKTTRKYHL